MTVHIPIAFRQRGGRKALVSPAGDLTPSSPTLHPSGYSPAVKALARAFRWRKLIETGVHSTIHDIAKAEGINPSYVSRVLRLTLLAPELIERTLADAPASVDDLTLPLPARWQDQTSLFLCSHPLGTSIVEQSR